MHGEALLPQRTEERCYNQFITFKGIDAAIEVHINSRIRELYKSDKRMDELFKNTEIYQLHGKKTRKEIISEIDSLVAILYSIDQNTLRKIALTFTKFYSKQEVEKLF